MLLHVAAAFDVLISSLQVNAALLSGNVDKQLYYGSLSAPQKHGSAWHMTLSWVNVSSLNRSVDMQLCHRLVGVSSLVGGYNTLLSSRCCPSVEVPFLLMGTL